MRLFAPRAISIAPAAAAASRPPSAGSSPVAAAADGDRAPAHRGRRDGHSFLILMLQIIPSGGSHLVPHLAGAELTKNLVNL